MKADQKVKGFPTGDIEVKRALDFATFEEFQKEANKLQGTTKDGDAKAVKLDTAKPEKPEKTNESKDPNRFLNLAISAGFNFPSAEKCAQTIDDGIDNVKDADSAYKLASKASSGNVALTTKIFTTIKKLKNLNESNVNEASVLPAEVQKRVDIVRKMKSTKPEIAELKKELETLENTYKTPHGTEGEYRIVIKKMNKILDKLENTNESGVFTSFSAWKLNETENAESDKKIDLQSTVEEIELGNYLPNHSYTESEGEDCVRLDYGNEQSVWLYDNGSVDGKLTPKLKSFLKSKGFITENIDEEDAAWLLATKDMMITEKKLTGGWWETRTQDKDLMRIADIIKKSDGDEAKAERLASTMCKLITTPEKAIRRGKAAMTKGMNALAGMFFERAIDLDSKADKLLTPEEQKTRQRGVVAGKQLGILDF